MDMAMLAVGAMGNVAFSLALGGLAALCALSAMAREEGCAQR
ncbi:hypothetical protein [Sphingobium phenoxybenzoativorans]|nr:hypothetical protein [Sphingobium phenoxybenzoativorans]